MIFKNSPENENVNDLEPDIQPDDEGGAAKEAAMIKKLKEDLRKCNQERLEYLDGWQRCKADSINLRRDAVLAAEKVGSRSRDALVEDVILSLDSFDMAMQGDGWTKADRNWRAGMENVRAQLISALKNQGVTAYAAVGEKFDPALHEILKEEYADGEMGLILQVVRKGYRSGDRVIRPAQVVIGAKIS